MCVEDIKINWIHERMYYILCVVGDIFECSDPVFDGFEHCLSKIIKKWVIILMDNYYKEQSQDIT